MMSVSTFLLLTSQIIVLIGAKATSLEHPSHCSTEAVAEHELRTLNDTLTGTSGGEPWWSVYLKMSLNETACFVQNNSTGPGSIMHTVKYTALVHHYPIKRTYQFGIPAIRQSCKCDCHGGETICSIDDYHYRNCTKGALCYRTYRSSQSSVGCPTSGPSDLCCQIQIDPYRDMRFTAVQLEQPSTFALLDYRIFVRKNRRWVREFADAKMKVLLNRGSARTDRGNHSIRISVGGGPPHRQVKEGAYFWDNQDRQLRGGVLLGEPNEKRLDRLGWLRWEAGQWVVHQGLEQIAHAQHISVRNCKAQLYQYSFMAEQYVLLASDDENAGGGEKETRAYDVGTLVRDEQWVQSVEVGEREVVIVHGEGTELSLHVKTKSRLNLVAYMSEFSNFNGTILVDSSSRCYMNLTFYDVRGTLIGELYRDEGANAVEMMFSVTTTDQLERLFHTTISAPSSLNSRRRLCIYPSGNPDAEKCAWLDFIAEPLRETSPLGNFWFDARSQCEGCNERGFDGFVERLDPRRWLFNGLQTPTDVFVLVVEVTLCLAAFLFSLIVLTKCIIPMFRCLVCVARPLRTSSSRKQLHVVEKF